MSRSFQCTVELTLNDNPLPICTAAQKKAVIKLRHAPMATSLDQFERSYNRLL